MFREKKKLPKEVQELKVIYSLVAIFVLVITVISIITTPSTKTASKEVPLQSEGTVNEKKEQEIAEPEEPKLREVTITITEFRYDTLINGKDDRTYEGKNDYTDTTIIVGAIAYDSEGIEHYINEDEIERFQTDDIALYLKPDNIGIQIGDKLEVLMNEYDNIVSFQ